MSGCSLITRVKCWSILVEIVMFLSWFLWQWPFHWGGWSRGNQEHPWGQEWAPASERGTWGTAPDTPSGEKFTNCYWISHLENWDADLDFASLDRLVALMSCREIFRRISQLLHRDGKQKYLSYTVLICLGFFFFFPFPVQVEKKDWGHLKQMVQNFLQLRFVFGFSVGNSKRRLICIVLILFAFWPCISRLRRTGKILDFSGGGA